MTTNEIEGTKRHRPEEFIISVGFVQSKSPKQAIPVEDEPLSMCEEDNSTGVERRESEAEDCDIEEQREGAAEESEQDDNLKDDLSFHAQNEIQVSNSQDQILSVRSPQNATTGLQESKNTVHDFQDDLDVKEVKGDQKLSKEQEVQATLLRSSMAIAKTELAESAARNAVMEYELEETNLKLESAFFRAKEYQEITLQQQNELEETRVQNTEFAHEVKKLQAKVNELEKYREDQNELEKTRGQNTKLAHKVEELQAKVNGLEKDSAKQKREAGRYQEMKDSLTSLTSTLEEMTKSNESLIAKNSELQGEIQDENEIKSSFATLATKLAQSNARNMALEKQLEENRNTIEAGIVEVEEWKESSTTLEKKLRDTKDLLISATDDGCKEEVDSLKEELASLQQKFEVATNIGRQEEKSEISCRYQLESSRSLRENLQAQINLLQLKSQGLSQKNKELWGKIKKTEMESYTEVEALKAGVGNLKNEDQKLKDLLEGSTTKCATLEKELSEITDTLEASINDTSELQVSLDMTRSELNDSHELNNNLKLQIEKFQSPEQELVDQTPMSNSRFESLEKELQEAKEKCELAAMESHIREGHLTARERELEKSQTKSTQLEAAKKELVDKLTESESRISALQREIQQTKDKCKSEIEDCEATEHAVGETLVESNSRVAALEKELEIAKEKCALAEMESFVREGCLKTGERELEDSHRVVKDLQSEIKVLQTRRGFLESKNQELQEELSLSAMKNSTLGRELQETMDEKIRELEANVVSLDSEKQNLADNLLEIRDRYSSLEEELKEVAKKHESLLEDNRIAEDKNQAHLKDLQTKIQGLELSNRQLMDDLEDSNKISDSLISELKDIKIKFQVATAEAVQQEEALSTNQCELLEATKENLELKEQISKLEPDSRASGLEAELEKIKEELKVSTSQAEQQKSDLENYEKESQETRNVNEQLTDLVKKLQRKVKKLELKNEKISDMLKKLYKQVKEHQATKDTINSLTGALEEVSEGNEVLVQQIVKLQDEVNAERKENKKLMAHTKMIKAEHQDSLSTAETKQTESNARISLLETANSQLKEELNTAIDVKLTESNTRFSLLESEKSRLQAELSVAIDAKSDFLRKMQEAHFADKATSERESDMMRMQTDELSRTVDELRQENLELVKERSQLLGKHEVLEREASQIRDALATAQIEQGEERDEMKTPFSLLRSAFEEASAANTVLVGRISELEIEIEKRENALSDAQHNGAQEVQEMKESLSILEIALEEKAESNGILSEKIAELEGKSESSEDLIEKISELQGKFAEDKHLKYFFHVLASLKLEQAQEREEMQESFSMMKYALQNMFESNEAMAGTISALKQEVEEKKNALADAEQNNARGLEALNNVSLLSHELEEMSLSNETLVQRIAELEGAIEESSRSLACVKHEQACELQETNESFLSLKNLLEEVSDSNDSLVVRICELENEIEFLKDENAKLKTMGEEQEIDEFKDTRQEECELISKSSISDDRDEKLLQSKYEFCKSELESLRDSFKTQHQSLTQQVAVCQKDLEDQKSCNLSLKNLISNLMQEQEASENDVHHSKEALVSAQNDANEAAAREEELRLQYENCSCELVSLGERQASLEADLATCQKELGDQEYCNGVFKGVIAKLNQSNDGLKKKFKKQSEQNGYLLSQNKNFSGIIATYHSKARSSC